MKLGRQTLDDATGGQNFANYVNKLGSFSNLLTNVPAVVTIRNDLSPSDHITDIVVRADRRANLIHRCFISRNVTLLVRAFLIYVRSLFEYNSIVWSPYHKCDIVAIENVQCRFTKRLPGFAEHSYSKRLLLRNLSSLELGRLHFDLIWCYKIIFGVVDISCSNIFALRCHQRASLQDFQASLFVHC